MTTTNRKRLIISIILYIMGFCIIACVFLFPYFLITAKPSIMLNGSPEITINVNDTYTDEGSTATIYGDIDITDEIFVQSDVDTARVGEYNIIYTIRNFLNRNAQSVTRKVIVIDSNAPTITLNGNSDIELYVNDTYTDEGATATDSYDGIITSKIITSGEVNTKKTGTYTIVYTVTDSSGNTSSINRNITVKNKFIPSTNTDNSNSYIVISIKDQMLWFYKNNELYLTSDIVTGKNGVYDTPTGMFSIYSKITDTYLVGPDYKSHVNYWMAFYKSDGMHDALWRNNFGGNIYLNDGSHGCVNLPYSTAKFIYENTVIGTPVKIY